MRGAPSGAGGHESAAERGAAGGLARLGGVLRAPAAWRQVERVYLLLAGLDLGLTLALHGLPGSGLAESWGVSRAALEALGKPATLMLAGLWSLGVACGAERSAGWRAVLLAALGVALYGAATWLRWVTW